MEIVVALLAAAGLALVVAVAWLVFDARRSARKFIDAGSCSEKQRTVELLRDSRQK